MKNRILLIVGIALTVATTMGNTTQAATLDCNSASNISVPINECQALLGFYDNTMGTMWNNNTNWDTDTNICTWYGIACTNIAGQDHISSITLPNNNLAGSINSSLSNIIHITSFDISNNQIAGVLPNSLSGWSLIENFNISNNAFEGILPDPRSTWTNIQSFDAGHNHIQGSLPNSRNSWTNIQLFNIYSNRISGTPPDSRNSWTNIQSCNIGGNQITGALPDSRSSWSNIQSFDISNNQINGTLPSSRSSWSSIQLFFVQNNQINGSLPSSRSSWSNIQSFDISNNQINGTFPDSRSTWSNIQFFLANSNQITGALPDSRNSWTNIRNFYINNNQISSIFPSSRSAWTNIVRFRAGFNQITGTLPSSRSSWSNIQLFFVQNNQINGSLPSSRSSWINLSSFWANNNQIRGIVPNSRTNNLINRGYQYINVNNNDCIKSIGYGNNAQTRINTNISINPQNNCISSDIAITKSVINPINLYPGNYIIYLISYVNNGSGDATNITIYDIPDTGLTITSANHPYSTTIIGGLTSYIFDVGALLSGASGQIVITGQVDSNIADTITGINNSVSIQSDSDDPITGNNTSFVSSILLRNSSSGGTTNTTGSNSGSTTNSFAGGGGAPLIVDVCPNGDHSPSYYDLICDIPMTTEAQTTGTVTETPTITTACPYTDGEFQHYKQTINDIPTKGRLRDSVNKLLDLCAVHGKNNEGQKFAPYDQITYGEMYKIATRSLGIDLLPGKSQHKLSTYYQTAKKNGLLKNIRYHQLDKAVSPEDAKQLLLNILEYTQSSPDTTIKIHGDTVSRSEFAKAITYLLDSKI